MFVHSFVFVYVLSLVVSVRCQISGYIVKGENAAIKDFPHSAWLGITCKHDFSRAWLCGASILNQRIVISAAHCFYQCNGHADINVNAGSNSRYAGFSTPGEKYVIHKRYDHLTNKFDVGLVKTKTPFEFSLYISRLAIMLNSPATGQAKLAGWGLFNEVSVLSSSILQQINQTIWNTAKCEQYIGEIPEGCFCAAHTDPTRYASDGDSGSALVVNEYIGIGMVSCKRPDYSDHIIVYTNFSYHYAWIQNNAEKLYCTT